MEKAFLELDNKGILPLDGEAPAEFLARGDRTLQQCVNITHRQKYIDKIIARIGRLEQGAREIALGEHCARIDKFRQGISTFGRYVEADLSWVPVFQFWQSEFDESCRQDGTTAGLSGAIVYDGYYLPYVALNMGFTLTGPVACGAHEAFHTIRRPLFGPIYLSGGDEFDHLGAMVIRPFRRWFAFTPYERQSLQAWLKLRAAFGQHAWYVFARSSYDEIVENILTPFRGMNPRSYLKWAGGFQSNLRFRIMCEQLGL